MRPLMFLSLASLVLMPIAAGVPRTYGQECTSVFVEGDTNDNRIVGLLLSAQEDCASVYGFYLQIERNGSVQEVTSTPSGWTYGMTQTTAFWTTETEPVDSDSQLFGVKLQTQKPYKLSWIALDQAMSPIAEGVLVG